MPVLVGAAVSLALSLSLPLASDVLSVAEFDEPVVVVPFVVFVLFVVGAVVTPTVEPPLERPAVVAARGEGQQSGEKGAGTTKSGHGSILLISEASRRLAASAAACLVSWRTDFGGPASPRCGHTSFSTRTA
ncbi:hypothetical protein [Nannocystis pusilla]|uniref:hypothetical protein n=1 Tax=Nannocystis pusilla TaxID=889268 RepID=UPI003DA68382